MNLYKLEKITNELNIQKQRLSKIVDYDNYKKYIEIDCLDIQENKVNGIVKFIEGVKTIKNTPFVLVLSGEVEYEPHKIIMSQNQIIYNDYIYGKNYILDINKNGLYGTNNYFMSVRVNYKYEKDYLKYLNKFDIRALLEGNNW